MPITSPWDHTVDELVKPLELIISSSEIKDELRWKIRLALQKAYAQGRAQGRISGYDERRTERCK